MPKTIPRLAPLLLVTSLLSLSIQTGTAINGDSPTGAILEYCLASEPFRAKCLSSEVIVMTSALYGRMRVGRCLQEEGEQLLKENNPQILGCSVDVLPILDRRCSAKNQCEVVLTFDADLQRKKPCRAGLMNYLEASYECVQVIEADRSCHVTVSSNPLHIMRSSSSTSSLLNCGTKTQPWVLESPAGQQINVSLLDVGQRAGTRERGEAERQNCNQQYGYIVDKAAGTSANNFSICGLADERYQIVYQSVSSSISLVLNPVQDLNSNDEQHTLIGFKAVGCSNVVPPDDAWLRRSNNEAVVGCYTSRQSWHLRCADNVWIGVIGNCTRELDAVKITEEIVASHAENQVLLPVAVGAIGLIICFVIIICGVICMRRYSAMSKGNGYIHHRVENKLGGGGGANYWHDASTQQAPLNGTTAGIDQQA